MADIEALLLGLNHNITRFVKEQYALQDVNGGECRRSLDD